MTGLPFGRDGIPAHLRDQIKRATGILGLSSDESVWLRAYRRWKRPPFNRVGGLSLVPGTPSFQPVVESVARLIEERGRRPGERLTPVDIATPDFSRRPSKETFVRLGGRHVREHDVMVITTGPGTDQMLMDLFWTLSYVGGRHAARITLITGYFPLCRSDKDEGDTELTMPPMLMALVEAACGAVGLHRWICVDPHSEQISMVGRPGQVTPVFLTRRVLKHAISLVPDPERMCLVFPDDSARKRYDAAREALEVEMGLTFPDVTALKRRISATKTKIVGIVGDPRLVRGRTAVMFDDEIATAGSMMKFARVLRGTDELKALAGNEAADVWGAATHAVLCGEAEERFTAHACPISRLIVTDTIPLPVNGGFGRMHHEGRLQIISWIEDLAWICLTHHWGGNLREIR